MGFSIIIVISFLAFLLFPNRKKTNKFDDSEIYCDELRINGSLVQIDGRIMGYINKIFYNHLGEISIERYVPNKRSKSFVKTIQKIIAKETYIDNVTMRRGI